ncbi:unnamed protein product [Fusarium graminearum]|uniref:Chromosome 1, complete genome n=2 Tax=Gibberella zeae TaxID=5518 RepID=A0A0E0RWG6_GIBZE|nr:hypothetical protein FG05_30387 [Fusarium graminearum]CAF3516777.1 unnamed protein product [Fusarium graminearum]CAF3562513.1 unnamed protein product [Fusarium graminearum]CAG1973558.1 unnamed protein product [Fusarium graminearum]CAG1998358.1 unnamed protein product [Fusarium graminearum]
MHKRHAPHAPWSEIKLQTAPPQRSLDQWKRLAGHMKTPLSLICRWLRGGSAKEPGPGSHTDNHHVAKKDKT